jgi:hypothetical protein
MQVGMHLITASIHIRETLYLAKVTQLVIKNQFIVFGKLGISYDLSREESYSC